MLIQRISREAMDAAHAAVAPKRAPAGVAAPPMRPRNVQHVLDLGNLIYFTFRGRAYGVPALAHKAGEELQALWLDASAYSREVLTPTTAPLYHALIRKLPGLLWRNTRPVGRVARLFHALHLHPNPFRRATERELVELAQGFLERRMISGVQFPPATSHRNGRTA